MSAAITRTSAVELGLVLTLVGVIASGVYAWTDTRKDVDQLQTLTSELREAVETMARSQVQRDLTLEGMRRDIGEVRAGVERLEVAIERQGTTTRVAGGRR